MASEPQINDEPATQPLVSATVGDRCVSCGTPMSSDQRYCVACGERRGKPRFSLPAGGTVGSPPSTELAPASASPPAPRAPRASSATTIVAGVGTLLLAMGVGVLIGRNSASNVNARPVQAAAPTVVTVSGGAGTPTAANPGPSKPAKKTSKSKGAKGRSKATNGSKPTAAQAAKASNAASKVLGSSNKNLPPATVTVGQTGHGPGYDKGGKFNGSFFGN
ncbi:MAG TPA: zinc ribbon domain-containing protein [Solirubrobacteraceae bacterium]|nr:zinc ribbon domain-containing protein [Solirubrobacteraceae bacterium]